MTMELYVSYGNSVDFGNSPRFFSLEIIFILGRKIRPTFKGTGSRKRCFIAFAKNKPIT